MAFFLRITKLRIVLVVAIVLGAVFIDCYSLFYRAAVAHEWFPKQLTSVPSIAGHPVTVQRGLDIQGGSEIVIQVCAGFDNPAGVGCRNGPPSGTTVSDARDRTIPLIQTRVNGLGVSEAVVSAQGTDQILVQIPGVGLDQAKSTIGTTAKLHFATPVQGAAGTPPAPDVCPPNIATDQENLCASDQLNNPAFYPQGYHWKIDDHLDASHVISAAATSDPNAPNEGAVQVNFDQDGANEWNKITTAAYQATQQTPQNQIAIFLDNRVISAPFVQSPSSNTTLITLGQGSTEADAEQLASLISEGSLPAEIATVQSTEVSATVGQDTITKTLIAGLVGLIIIALFMLGYYRWAGLLAVLALGAYGAIVLAIYKLVPVTVSLAGLAGFVLSVGMAVDANVLIFERTRDELRHGKSVALAVETGFRRAFPAIRDSNVSTIIACVILYYFGTSVVRGFALTLGVGVAISFFSAVMITRALFAWALRRKFFRSPDRYTEIHPEYETSPPKGRFDIVRSRNWYFLGSLVVIVPGILAIIIWGFRLGLDFQGGYKLDVHLAKTAQLSDITTTINNLKDTNGDPLVASRQLSIQAESDNHFSIRFLPTSGATDAAQTIDSALQSQYGIAKDSKGNPDVQEQFIGPSVASSLIQSAVILVLVASAFIAAYLAWAFRRQRNISSWRFAACTFLKLLHDVFVLAGIWAILGHFWAGAEVDTLFVTALLTSVAFSIHDTIVVFDRVRENLRFGPRLTFDQVINLSTIQTMTRSLNTSLTVVFVLLALVLFGGQSIQGFVLALLIGIATGTYSSIFNASTLLVAWQKARGEERTGPPGRGVRRVQTRAA